MVKASRTAAYAGIFAVVFLLSKIHATRHGYDYTESIRFAYSLVLIASLALSAYGSGVPDLPRTKKSARRAALQAAVVAPLFISVVQLVAGDALLPRFVVFGSALMLGPWFYVCTLFALRAEARAEQRDRVFIVGNDASIEAVTQELELRPERPAALAGALSVDSAGDEQAIAQAVLEARATVLVLDRKAQGVEHVIEAAAKLHGAGVRVRTLSLFYEQWLGKLPVFELERVALMFDIGEVHRARYMRIKRLADATVALLGLPVLVIAAAVVVAGNVAANRGPLLFRQARVGRNGRSFDILKFRTMTATDSEAHEWTGENDPRVTPFGRVLRRSHVDELPQLWNVLRGDLSIVGPRPEQPGYVEALVEKLPFYSLRHLVTPGLTGWAQVKFGYADSDSGALEKLQYDFYYLLHQSFTVDARIMIRTVRNVARLGGR